MLQGKEQRNELDHQNCWYVIHDGACNDYEAKI